MKNVLTILLLIFFCSLVLVLSIRGYAGVPKSNELNSNYWTENGPFEVSPERGRFALLYSFIENHSFYFSNELAQFALPDVAVYDNHYVSLFAPGVSFIAIPGYLVGKAVGFSQVGTFATISLFALMSTLLIRSIAIRLGANSLAATLASLVFLFATPAYSYAVTLYQHHISTFLILLSIYILLRWKSIWSLTLIWLLYAIALIVDYPNLLLMFPIVLYALGRIFIVKIENSSFRLDIKLLGLLTFAGATIPLAFLIWFNISSYNNPFQLAGTLNNAQEMGINSSSDANLETKIEAAKAQQQLSNSRTNQTINPESQKKDLANFFKTRNMFNGFYAQTISSDRGILYFTPVILLGLIGLVIEYRKKSALLLLFISILGVNIMLYAMWGDPYGGWAFGSRYLIPTYAILAILIAKVLTRWKASVLFLTIFSLLLIYSTAVNSLGALTTNRNPPQVEILALEALTKTEQKYTYEKNIQYLQKYGTKSFVFQTWEKQYLTPVQYYWMVTGIIVIVEISLIASLYFLSRKERYDQI